MFRWRRCGGHPNIDHCPRTCHHLDHGSRACNRAPPSGCCDGVEISTGTYQLPIYWGIPLTVEVEEGWRAIFDNSAALMAFAQGQNAADDPSRWLYLIRAPEEVSPEDAIADMAAMTAVSVTAGPGAVEIAGFPG
ncbi:MAG: hypothetical protein WEE53_00480, partial [Acidimicrobiia bacterium]